MEEYIENHRLRKYPDTNRCEYIMEPLLLIPDVTSDYYREHFSDKQFENLSLVRARMDSQ